MRTLRDHDEQKAAAAQRNSFIACRLHAAAAAGSQRGGGLPRSRVDRCLSCVTSRHERRDARSGNSAWFERRAVHTTTLQTVSPTFGEMASPGPRAVAAQFGVELVDAFVPDDVCP